MVDLYTTLDGVFGVFKLVRTYPPWVHFLHLKKDVILVIPHSGFSRTAAACIGIFVVIQDCIYIASHVGAYTCSHKYILE